MRLYDRFDFYLKTYLIFCYCQILVNAINIRYEYDKGSPWRKLISSGDLESYHDLAIPFIRFDAVDHWDDETVSHTDISSSRLPTEMLLTVGHTDTAFNKIPLAKRQALYRQTQPMHVRLHDQLEADFIFYFSWCVHAKMAQACEEAALLIKNGDHDFAHIDFHAFNRDQKIKTIDGSASLAQNARQLFLKRALTLQTKLGAKKDLGKTQDQIQSKEIPVKPPTWR